MALQTSVLLTDATIIGMDDQPDKKSEVGEKY